MKSRLSLPCRLLPHGLFWLVFLSIAAAVALSALMSFGLFYASYSRNLERVFAQDYTGLTSQVRQALDDSTLIELQNTFQEEKHAMLVVLEGRQPLGIRPPHWVMTKLHRKTGPKNDRPPRRDKDEAKDRDREHRDFELMQTRLQHQGRAYRIIILPTPDAIRSTAKPLIMVVFILILALCSSVIAWTLTKPIRILQTAARQLSTGDMAARVPDKVSSRRDSIGDLGSDFNHMAGRIQQLLSAQQQLLRDVSHELRTPLARMQVALVLAEDKPETAANQLSRIDTEIDRLNTLIGSILSLSKVESGAAKLDESEFGLDTLLQQVAQDAEFEFSDRGITVAIDSPAQRFYGDREQLRSALENIVRNAMRYGGDSGQIELSMRRTGNTISISVRDHGPGVAQDHLQRLFEAFYRAESARSAQKHGGHGVGLAISRSITVLHGGQISAENAQGGGLLVRIELPISRLR